MPEEMPTDVKESLLSSVAEPKPAKQGPNKWAGLLLILFLISTVCGVYLTVKPGVKCPKQTDKKEGVSSAFSSLTAKNDNGNVAWIKVRGVIATENSSSPFINSQSSFFTSLLALLEL